MIDERRSMGPEERRTYRTTTLPLQDMIQGQAGGSTAIHRAIRPNRLLQPGNTPWRYLRPGGFFTHSG